MALSMGLPKMHTCGVCHWVLETCWSILDAGRVTLWDSISGAWLLAPLMSDATLKTWVGVARFLRALVSQKQP